MRFLYYLSDSMIPLVLILVTGYGLLQKVDIFDAFIEGAVDGFKTVYKILPTLIGLMIAIGILRESGTLGYVASVIAPVTERLHFPSELVPLVTVKMFSSSAATSLLLDVYKQFGPDSRLGAYELLGDHFLHNECVFYDSESDKDKIYTCRCFVCDACRNCHVNAAYRVLIFRMLLKVPYTFFPLMVLYARTRM